MGRRPTFEQGAVVDKAMEVFWRQGYAGTTPQVLVEELGIGKGSLYNTFESKHHLFTLALRGYSTMRVRGLAEGLGGPGAIKSRLRATVVELTGVGTHRRGCLVVNSIAELGLADTAVAEVGPPLFDRIEEAFRSAVERGRRDGELREGDASDAAQSLLATVIGTSVLSRTSGDLERLGRGIDAAIERL